MCFEWSDMNTVYYYQYYYHYNVNLSGTPFGWTCDGVTGLKYTVYSHENQ